MNTIKLPVTAIECDEESVVVDASNRIICSALWMDQAHQIALALNLHDELVAMLKSMRRGSSQADAPAVDALIKKATPMT